MRNPPGDEHELLARWQSAYDADKQALADTIERGVSGRELSGARQNLFLSALALLTYGRLDAVGDVLENMPAPLHPANRGLAPAVNDLIPAPITLRAGTAPDDLLGWVRAHEAQLRWDEDAGRFVLDES